MLKHCKTVMLVGAQYQYSSVRLLARVCASDGRFLLSADYSNNSCGRRTPQPPGTFGPSFDLPGF